MRKINRRTFAKLLGVGAAAGAIPFLRHSPAAGQLAPIPKRVLFIYSQEGMLLGDHAPRPAEGASATTETSFRLPRSIEALSDYQRDIIAFENLDMVTHTKDATSGANAHLAGETHALSAAFRSSGELCGGPTIDQFIAQQINREGLVTVLPSLEVICQASMAYNEGIGFGGARKTPFASSAGEYVDALGRPEEIFERVFPADARDTGVDVSAVLARQQRMYDFLRGEHGAVASRLSANDRRRIEDHMELLSNIEARGRLLAAAEDRRALWPDPSMVDPARDLSWRYNDDRASIWYDRYQVATPLNMQIVASALHADVTRVASVWMTPPPPEGLGYSAGDFGSSDWHDLIHKCNDPDSVQASDPEVRALILRQLDGMWAHVRTLLDTLASLTEVDGSRLLDHTLVVFTTQIACGNHQLEQLPWFTVGNHDGYFTPGRLLRFDRTPDPERSWRDDGRPHNDLFVSVANGMGVGVDSFGEASVCTGPIAEMRG